MSPSLPAVQVALSLDFMKAFGQVPRGLQHKVRLFVEKFMANPTSPGLNYEVIRDARDANLRSVRVDDTYRAIVLAPRKGNVYALLWVDHHDDAYAWARRRQVLVHPTTGSLQVLVMSPEAELAIPEGVALTAAVPEDAGSDAPELSAPAAPLFTGLSDADMARLGVPAGLVPRLRTVVAEAECDGLASEGILPPEAHEALALWRVGFSADEILEDRLGRYATDPPVVIDPEDFSAALEKPETRARFRMITDDTDLQRMLDAPSELWRVFLHPTQQRLVQHDAKGPVRVLGGAGTGKTVVALHRAVHLAREVFTAPHDRILVTTYTRNLADDLSASLDLLVSGPVRARIEVAALDGWVLSFLNRHADGPRRSYAWKGDENERAWKSVAGEIPDHLTSEFVRDEFERVVLEHGLMTEADYLHVSRAGRGTALARGDRRRLWQVFEAYRRRLAQRSLIERGDAMREATSLLCTTPGLLPYRAVVVDEAQDLGHADFRLLREVAPRGANSLFIVGDAHQRLYGRKVVLSRCDIEVRGRRSTHLRLNYRTTDGIRAWAVRLLEGQPIDDLDDGADSARGYRSVMHGPPPEVVVTPSLQDELRVLADHLQAWQAEGTRLEDMAVVARTKAIVDRYAQGLEAIGLEVYRLKEDGDRRDVLGVRLATMHRVKGLEFERVCVAGANAGELPLASVLSHAVDAAGLEEAERTERSLLYVAITRARKAALVTASGVASPFLKAGGQAG